MSSLARRSLRTTAATAGIAALGLGLAGHAFAAPAAPELPALPGADSLGGPDLPATPALPSEEGFFMPGVANIEMPNVNTAAPELPAGDAFAVPTAPEFAAPAAPAAPELPGNDALPALPGADSLPTAPGAPSTDGLDMEFDVDPTGDAMAASSADGFQQNSDSALAALDMAQEFMALAQGAAADGPSTQDNEIG